MPSRRRISLFAVLCAAVVTIGAVYVGTAVQRDRSARSALSAIAGDAPEGPHLVFLRTQGDAYRVVSVASLDASSSQVAPAGLECQRVHVAAGSGLCVGLGSLGGAAILDSHLRPVRELAIEGLASRARVSADGKYGAMTTFVRGHSYSEVGFSTLTLLVDIARQTVLSDLESFKLIRDGAPYEPVDRNYWGVTFMPHDSDRFYATVGTSATTYLVSGRVSDRTLRVMRENVECPSLSPDGSRLVFKKRFNSGLAGIYWRLFVLDLASVTERPLAETHSVDDQVEWLDATHIIYALPDQGPPTTLQPDLWSLDVDSQAAPVRIRTEAMSPAVVR